MIDVWLVTSEGACGIAEHSSYLRDAVKAADPEIGIRGNPESLDPKWFFHSTTFAPFPKIVHLNYHAALHSRWHPSHVQELQRVGIRVVVTYHDTGVPNSDQCRALHAVADAFVVHEPCADLPGAIYWRQGVPARHDPYVQEWQPQPVVGTVGFPFPWKNIPLLIEAAAIAGWTPLIIAPTATEEQVRSWPTHPRAQVYTDFLPSWEVVALLSGCDATAFVYNCHNTGTSGAIRQGIAARKPVIASRFDEYCTAGRQFRDLVLDPLASRVMTWINPDVQQLADALSQVRIAPIDAGMVALAAQDSWASLGAKYAQLYRSLL